MVKIKIYGYAKERVSISRKQRYWKKRKDGIKQRYWKKSEFKQAVGQNKYEERYVEKKELKKEVREEWEQYKWDTFDIESPKEEIWKRIGKVLVTRRKNGRLVSWQKI